MQTSKFLVAAGVMAAVMLPFQSPAAPDTETQAQMREALRKKMEELSDVPAAPVVAPPAAPPAPAPVQVTPPPAAPAPVAPKPVVATPTTRTSEAERARMQEALRRQMEQVNAPAPAAAQPRTEVIPPPAAASGNVRFDPVPAATMDEANRALAQEALRRKMQELQAAPPVAAPVAPAPVAVKPGSPPSPPPPATAVLAPPSATPILVPESPLPGTKQARLAELLARYKADTITAMDYHTQRAAILAEP